MNWWEWVFSGIGVSIPVLFLASWLRRKRGSRASGHEAAVTAQGGKVSDSPVASGSGITQTVMATHHHYYPPVETSSASPPSSELIRGPEEAPPSSKIIVTATPVIGVFQAGRSEWSDGNSEYQALVIQFTNEAAQWGYQNSEPIVRPSLVYSDEQNKELLRITGGWINTESDVAAFRLEESHKLLVGILLGGQLAAFEYIRTPAPGRGDYINMVRRSLADFLLGTVRVRLTGISSKTLLYEGYFDIGINPLGIAERTT
jgi:hypothetical protein